MLKRGYVNLVHRVRPAARRLGVTTFLEDRLDRRWAHWLRSQLSIYDFEDLDRLDAPWWSYGAIDAVEAWLDRRDGPVRAFEWGAGASTLWLERRVDNVVSVEHDIDFARRLRPHLSDRTVLDPVEPCRNPDGRVRSLRKGHEGLDFSAYVDRISTLGADAADLIVIDGRARAACALTAPPHLSPTGIIVFDNSDRSEYRATIDQICREHGLREDVHRGWAPALPLPTQTSILRKQDRTAVV